MLNGSERRCGIISAGFAIGEPRITSAVRDVGEMSGDVYGSTSRSKRCPARPALGLAGLFHNNPRFSVPMAPPTRCGFFDTSRRR